MFNRLIFFVIIFLSFPSQSSTGGNKSSTVGNYGKKIKTQKQISKKVLTRKPNSHVMGKSKTEIRMILDSLDNDDGAYVQLIRKISNDTYKVDLKSITGICVGHRMQVVKINNRDVLSLLDRVYECD